MYSLAISMLAFALMLPNIMGWKQVLPVLFQILGAFCCAIMVTVALLRITAGQSGVAEYSTQIKNTVDVTNQSVASEKNLTRSYTVKVALETAVRHPWGIGPGAFGSLPEHDWMRRAGNPRQTVNSLYPQLLVENGVIGLMLFLSFLALIAIRLLRVVLATGETTERRVLNLTLFSIIFAIFLQFASFSTLYLFYLWGFLGLALAILESAGSIELDDGKAE
jgi:hypothetical protein